VLKPLKFKEISARIIVCIGMLKCEILNKDTYERFYSIWRIKCLRRLCWEMKL